MTTDNPEIRAQVLDWQRRHNIRDDDPAMALLELLDVYYRPQLQAVSRPPEISAESVTQAVKSAVTPLLERLSTQIQSGAHSSLSPEAITATVKSALAPAIDRVASLVQDLDNRKPADPNLSPEAITATVKSALVPAIDRVASLVQDLDNRKPADVNVSSEAISEAIRMALMPAIERVTFQTQELKNEMETIDLEKFSGQIAAYHDGIDYCTKKLDVVKKESDALLVRLDRASASIKPVTKGAVMFLMGISGVVGYVLAVILR